MKFHGDIDLNNNEFQNAAMEDEADFPVSPPKGRIIFREGRVFMAVDIIGNVTWVPLTNTINTHMHLQTSASITWNITHNLNSSAPLVQIYDDTGAGSMFIPDDVTITDEDSLVVTLGAAAAGRAMVMAGDMSSNGNPAYAFVHEQTVSSSAWVVTHALGYEPLVRVFVGNVEVQPLSIVHDTVNQTTINFSVASVGFARFI